MEVNKIYNEDCLETMKKMPDNFLDLTVTSPPYNCGIDYDSYDDNKDWQDYLMWVERWMSELYRVTKNSGRICINVLVEMGIEGNKRRVSPMVAFHQIIEKVGFKVFGMPMWTDSHRVKYTAWGSWMKASSPYIYNPFEVIIVAYKGQWKKEHKGESTISKEDFMMGCSGVWNLKTQTKQITKANFHEDLPSLCINLLSFKNDLVYDPFTGSGTTATVCVKSDRQYVGSEISSNYFEIANKRIGEAIQDGIKQNT
jgi:site-specific DNA-methyltransferase (adenine-specific)